MMRIPKAGPSSACSLDNVILGFGDPESGHRFRRSSCRFGGHRRLPRAWYRRVNHHDDRPAAWSGRGRRRRIVGDRVVLHPAGGGRQQRRRATSLTACWHCRYRATERWWSTTDGLAPTAVEEIVRGPPQWSTCTLTQDIELRGMPVTGLPGGITHVPGWSKTDPGHST